VEICDRCWQQSKIAVPAASKIEFKTSYQIFHLCKECETDVWEILTSPREQFEAEEPKTPKKRGRKPKEVQPALS